MRRTAIELGAMLAGLLVAAGLTWAVAWSYPLGAEVAWWCGAGAMMASVLMGIGPLRRAWTADRRRR